MLPENIKKACLLAKHPGRAMYYVDDKPSCFIAQLNELEGLKNPLMEGASFSTHQIVKLEKYGIDRLQDLQDFWDRSEETTNEELLEFAEKIWQES
jgi:hypothetical protein